MSGDAPILTARGVSRDFPLPRQSLFAPRPIRHALRGVDLDLIAGASLGIVGESGSGKSTLVRILLGLDRPTSGAVTFLGREVTPGPPRTLRWLRREMQIILQDPASSLDPRQRVEEIIAEPLVCLDVEEDHAARIDEVLVAVGLEPGMRERYPHEFSGGQQQRIAIARAIAPRPSVLVGDEPVSALDVSVRTQILDLLADLAARHQMALILVSHDLGVVRYLCDDVLVLHDGTVVEHGRSTDVLDHPSDDYTKRLVAAVPRLPH
ncbi:MAG: ATP-binding cassette domain-containing protein [Desertimonas sp.]